MAEELLYLATIGGDTCAGSQAGGLCVNSTCICKAACLDARLTLSYSHASNSSGVRWLTPTIAVDYNDLTLSDTGTASKQSGGKFASCTTAIQIYPGQGGGGSYWSYNVAGLTAAESGSGDFMRTRIVERNPEYERVVGGTDTDTYTIRLQTDLNRNIARTKIRARFYHAFVGGSTVYEPWVEHSGISTATNNYYTEKSYTNTYQVTTEPSAPGMWYEVGVQIQVSSL